uniref:Uncharacterized protein n=1 Tax=Anopheles melas TaxID=34690 RepID=A0A182UI33_9DIPT
MKLSNWKSDGDGFCLQVTFERVFAQLTPNAGLFVAAERSLVYYGQVSVDPNGPSFHRMAEGEGLVDVVCDNTSGQSKRGIIGAFDRLIQCAIFDNALHRAEYFFLRDSHVVCNVGKNRWLNEVTLVADRLASSDQFRTLLLTDLDVAEDLLVLRIIDLWPVNSSFRERVANFARLCQFARFLDELIVDALVYKGTRSRYTTLSLVLEHCHVGDHSRLVNCGAVSGVCSAGFMTIVQPAARAGPHFHANIASG